MIEKNIKIIATDLDDTLLRRDKTISEYTKSVFAQCREKGILIAFVTARTAMATERYRAQILPDILISDTGALVRHGSKALYKAIIPDAEALVLVQKCLENPGILQITVQAENGYFDSKPLDKTTPGWEDYACKIETDFSRPIDYGEIYKVSVLTNGSKVAVDITKHFPKLVLTNYRNTNWYAFNSGNASKDRALAAVIDALDITTKNVVAFGDDAIDAGMLRFAGRGVAVQNAVPEVKAVADCICGDCDNDGVAKWIDENIL